MTTQPSNDCRDAKHQACTGLGWDHTLDHSCASGTCQSWRGQRPLPCMLLIVEQAKEIEERLGLK